MLLPRLADHLGATDCLFLPPRLIARIFVISDIITFFVQAAGGGLSSSKNTKTVNVATKVSTRAVPAGGRKDRRSRSRSPWSVSSSSSYRLPSSPSSQLSFGSRPNHARRYWLSTGVRAGEQTGGFCTPSSPGAVSVSSCVGSSLFSQAWAERQIRNGYRVAEYALGWDGVLQSTEVYFYVLDSLPLIFAIAPWTIIWAPLYLRPRVIYGTPVAGPQVPSEEFKMQPSRAA